MSIRFSKILLKLISRIWLFMQSWFSSATIKKLEVTLTKHMLPTLKFILGWRSVKNWERSRPAEHTEQSARDTNYQPVWDRHGRLFVWQFNELIALLPVGLYFVYVAVSAVRNFLSRNFVLNRVLRCTLDITVNDRSTRVFVPVNQN